MTAQPLARFLLDFERERTRARTAPQPSEPSPDRLAQHRAEVEAARIAGREEGRAEALRETERLLADVRAEGDARLAAERAVWARDEGAALAILLGEGLAALERSIADLVAAVLEGLVLTAVRDRMVADLAAALRDLLARDPQALRVQGPPDLLDALRDRLPEHVGSVVFVAAAGLDIRVAAGDAALVTRLAAWRDSLRAESA